MYPPRTFGFVPGEPNPMVTAIIAANLLGALSFAVLFAKLFATAHKR